MLPIELRRLQELSQLFEGGKAGFNEAKELSKLLSLLNNSEDTEKALVSLNEPY